MFDFVYLIVNRKLDCYLVNMRIHAYACLANATFQKA